MRVIGVIGLKNSGKTTLICDILKEINKNNINIAIIKHSSHDVEIDKEGTDSY
ncbi:MAG TPA: molybdopterin-guanine dinucleotide biosynthesis protein MobB, partial [Candidatus Nanopusillus sp.]|nr:molybdopterin-guanine dinucleotide biosynthesis protein MobB [Candidatus Nanopusillus sp.]